MAANTHYALLQDIYFWRKKAVCKISGTAFSKKTFSAKKLELHEKHLMDFAKKA
jgi:hypothetical protein